MVDPREIYLKNPYIYCCDGFDYTKTTEVINFLRLLNIKLPNVTPQEIIRLYLTNANSLFKEVREAYAVYVRKNIKTIVANFKKKIMHGRLFPFTEDFLEEYLASWFIMNYDMMGLFNSVLDIHAELSVIIVQDIVEYLSQSAYNLTSPA
jgi:hypothetical protein